jgi:hypothetical protein
MKAILARIDNVIEALESNSTVLTLTARDLRALRDKVKTEILEYSQRLAEIAQELDPPEEGST